MKIKTLFKTKGFQWDKKDKEWYWTLRVKEKIVPGAKDWIRRRMEIPNIFGVLKLCDPKKKAFQISIFENISIFLERDYGDINMD